MRMNLYAIDWMIIVLFLASMLGLTLFCQRYVRTVADFLAAGRIAGRYLLTVSQGLSGAIAIIAAWEMIYAGGLPTQWWAMMGIPVGMLLSLTGFIAYRFRQTRALTLAQFFEMRYSRRFRLFAGLLSWLAGILNYGIFPAVTTRFFIYFFGLPADVHVGTFTIGTFPLLMFAYLSFAAFTAISGGQISIMITDFFQGMLTLLIFVGLLLFLFYRFSWGDIVAGLQVAPAGESLLNPFKADRARDFNIWYFVIAIFGQVYNARSWQGTSGYNAAAKSPHEAKMAGIVGAWRSFAQSICLLLIPLAAYAILHHPEFATLAAPIQSQIAAIQDETIRNQMTVPIFLTHILPAGLLGLFGAIMLSAAISCDNTYMHSWGTIFIQDVVLPLRKKPLSQKTHLLWLRLSILGVAAFGFTFSMLFPLKQYVLMFFALTGAIYLGGAGAVIIGGLYWKRGTTPAAWTALISGSALAFGGIIVEHRWKEFFWPLLNAWLPQNSWLMAHAERFPLNGQLIYFIAMMTASVLYILVSLLGPRQVYNLDELLHRGHYAPPGESSSSTVKIKQSWTQLLGMTPEFKRIERVLFWCTLGWSMGWWGIFLVGCLIQAVVGTTDAGWSTFWWFKIWLCGFLGIGLSMWMVWGGLRDGYRMFRDLNTLHKTAGDSDNGIVTRQLKTIASADDSAEPAVEKESVASTK